VVVAVWGVGMTAVSTVVRRRAIESLGDNPLAFLRARRAKAG